MSQSGVQLRGGHPRLPRPEEKGAGTFSFAPGCRDHSCWSAFRGKRFLAPFPLAGGVSICDCKGVSKIVHFCYAGTSGSTRVAIEISRGSPRPAEHGYVFYGVAPLREDYAAHSPPPVAR